MIMILKRSSTVLLMLIFVVIGLIAGVIARYIPYSQAMNMTDDNKIKVIVDAGHGAPDGGTTGLNGVGEKDVNLAIALKLQEVLEGKGIDVIMTRSGDESIYDKGASTIREKKKSDMLNRLAIMKKSNADLFISIHMNSFQNSNVDGLNIFYSKNHAEIKPLAENIQRRMYDVTQAKMHIIKTADSSLFLMHNPPLPAVLVECGFLSNAEEEKKLASEDYQSRLAWAIADAVEKYYANIIS